MRHLRAIPFFLLLTQSAWGQLVLNSGDVWTFNSDIPVFCNCCEFFGEGGIFQAPVRQVARLRVKFGNNALEAAESIRVHMFDNLEDFSFFGASKTNATFHGPTNSIELLVPDTWTNNRGFIQLQMLSGSAVITNISLATKYISGSGCAWVLQTNIINFTPPLPGPRLTLDTSVAPFFFYLIWPTNAVGYRLEEANTMLAPVWQPVTNFIGTAGTNHGFVFDAYDFLGNPLPPRYFRLRKPF